MAISRNNREYKKRLGQYMTPLELAKSYIFQRNYELTDLILEPSFGTGNFLISIIDRYIQLYKPNDVSEFVTNLLEKNIYAVELDVLLYNKTIQKISDLYDVNFDRIDHNLYADDFFDVPFFNIRFDYIEGNPPFGGSFDEEVGIKLDKIYGKYKGIKVKKETYAFFIYRCIGLLKPKGQIGFICSNTFMTIPTMKGIRKMILDNKTVIYSINSFSDETDYPMVYFNLSKEPSNEIIIDGKQLNIDLIELTDTLSFSINAEYEKYFRNGQLLSEYLVCSSGMTIGKNELFLKEVIDDKLLERYSYTIKREPKTLEKERKRARLGRVSKSIMDLINSGTDEAVLEIEELIQPVYVDINDQRYRPYNKASSNRFYTKPTSYIFWENEGEAVLTFKKTGPWYLHGVGGARFFGKELLTWRLISNDIRCRYLPEGYILDSGAPVGKLKDDIDSDELYFIIGWLNTDLATDILKNVINHTRNIQSKDIERLPYPIWVSDTDKKQIVDIVKKIVNNEGVYTFELDTLNMLFNE